MKIFKTIKNWYFGNIRNIFGLIFRIFFKPGRLVYYIIHPSEGFSLLLKLCPVSHYLPILRVFVNFPSLEQSKKKVIELNTHNHYQHTLIFPSPSMPWDFMVQRPQQLAKNLAGSGALTIYATQWHFNHLPDKIVRTIMYVDDNLYLFNDGRNGRSLEVLNCPIVWQYWVHQNPFIENIRGRKIKRIYDWVDDLEVYGYTRKELEAHRQLLKTADIVITSAASLFEEAQKVRPDSVLITNGCDFNSFRNPSYESWPELEELRKNNELIAGYYGSLSPRHFDWELVAYCAKKMANWLFLLVGPGTDKKSLKKYGIDKLTNVVIWLEQPYRRIPQLLMNFNVAIIPFKVNTITKAVSPIKMFEYMAGGFAPVTTKLPECMKCKGNLVGDDFASFGQLIEKAYEYQRNKEFQEILYKEAWENRWNAKVQRILDILKERAIIE